MSAFLIGCVQGCIEVDQVSSRPFDLFRVIIKLIPIWCVFLLLSEHNPQRYQLALIPVMPDVRAASVLDSC